MIIPTDGLSCGMGTEQFKNKFWRRVNKNGPLPDQKNHHYTGLERCWQWTGRSLNRGYGSIQFRGRVIKSHRGSYELSIGPIPRGMWVLHKCDNKLCVNPSHLFLGTRKDNVDDMMKKGRHRVPSGDAHTARLHPERMYRGVQNTASKLDDDKVRSIRIMRSNGEHFRVIAKRFGVSSRAIVLITQRKTWRHVT